MTAFILEADGLVKTFVLHLLGGRRIEALRGATLKLEEGEFVAVVGATGAGKSTLLKAIRQIYRLDAGVVLYRRADGKQVNLAALPENDLIDLVTREIGYVPQYLHVAPRVGALDLLIEAAPGLAPDAAREYARELFAMMALPPDMESVYPVTFSGGEKQRLNLALTLMRRPRLLLLDEPTAALDAATRDRIVDVLAEQKRSGVSCIGIFHDLDAVACLADRVIEINAGRIVSERTTAVTTTI